MIIKAKEMYANIGSGRKVAKILHIGRTKAYNYINMSNETLRIKYEKSIGTSKLNSAKQIAYSIIYKMLRDNISILLNI